MTHRERFRALFERKPVDRIPVYFFGSWRETKIRWKEEGLQTVTTFEGDPGPEVPGMDPDWESGLWDCHGLVYAGPVGNQQYEILEETESDILFKNSLGDVVRDSKTGSTIAHTLEYGLKPTRESWERFKTFLDADDPRRRPVGWEQKAEALEKSDRVLAFMGGSLYGWLRGWMGVEQISLLMYDDPKLLEDMIAHLSEYFMKLHAPILEKVHFDLVYFFEDCCGVNGPLFSPSFYQEVLDPYYRQMLGFYKRNGVALSLIDSDGMVEKLVPSWMGSGFDILFPVEVGTWGASAGKLREKFGSDLNMLGGVDKHVIPKGEAAIRAHLTQLKPTVDEGGYLPIPDHRIPPECSLSDFQTYLRVFNEVFNGFVG